MEWITTTLSGFDENENEFNKQSFFYEFISNWIQTVLEKWNEKSIAWTFSIHGQSPGIASLEEWSAKQR